MPHFSRPLREVGGPPVGPSSPVLCEGMRASVKYFLPQTYEGPGSHPGLFAEQVLNAAREAIPE